MIMVFCSIFRMFLTRSPPSGLGFVDAPLPGSSVHTPKLSLTDIDTFSSQDAGVCPIPSLFTAASGSGRIPSPRLTCFEP